MGVVWPSPSFSLVKESEYVARFLSNNGYSQYLLETNYSAVTFEDHVEIVRHHFKNGDEFDPYAAQATKAQEE